MSPATWWAAVYEDTAEAVAAWLAGNRLAGSPSAANYFLNLVTDSTPIRHCREKFDILFENLQPQLGWNFAAAAYLTHSAECRTNKT
jgi:hypothetical protein